MAELLQLHVTVPDDDRGEYRPLNDDPPVERYRDLITIVDRQIGVPPAGWDPSEAGGGWVSSRLFERRPDNMDAVEDVRYQLACRYPDADVFWSERPRVAAGYRSAADPNTDLVLEVANWGSDAAHVCWQTDPGRLRGSPVVDVNRIYHLEEEGIVKTDVHTGQTMWDLDLPDTPLRVIVTGSPFVVGRRTVTSVTSTGHVLWQTDIDGYVETATDSFLVADRSVIYLGLRSGEIVTVDGGDGSVTELAQVPCVRDAVGVRDGGVIVDTGSGQLVCLRPDGAEAWTRQVAQGPIGMTVQDGVLYRSTEWGVLAVDVRTDTGLWRVETPVAGEPAVADERLLVPTTEGLVALDLGDGSVDWDLRFPGGGHAGPAVVAHGEVATIQSRPVKAGGDLEEFSRKTLRVLDLEDGHERLTYDIGAGRYRLAPVADDRYLVASRTGLACVDTQGSPPPLPPSRSRSVS